ncbi:MAG: hypothetical protein QM498_00105 [Desulfobacterium sp.]
MSQFKSLMTDGSDKKIRSRIAGGFRDVLTSEMSKDYHTSEMIMKPMIGTGLATVALTS